MSKNFEEEYRRMTDSEIPDLWDRIESRIDALPLEEAVEEEAVEEAMEEAEAVPGKRIAGFFNRRRTAALITAAAAALCLLIARPASLKYRDNRNDGVSPPASDNFLNYTENMGIAASDGAPSKGGSVYQDAPQMAAEADSAAEGVYGEPNEAPACEGILPAADSNDGTASEGNKDFAGVQNVSDSVNSSGTGGKKPAEAEINGETGIPGLHIFLAEVRICDVTQDEQGNPVYEAEVIRSEYGEQADEKELLFFRFAAGAEIGAQEPETPLGPGQRCILSLYRSGEPAETDNDTVFPEICIVYWLDDADF